MLKRRPRSVCLDHRVEIAVPVAAVFAYVTQPWLWHEWHPASRETRCTHSFLTTGDEFVETVLVRPLPLLPFAWTRQVEYTITEAVPEHTWEAEGRMQGGWLRLRYDFEPAEDGASTIFCRRLEFALGGANRLIMPVFARHAERQSRIALENLKGRLQQQAAHQP